MAETKTLVTLEEFRKMAEATDDRLELVNGEVLRMGPPGWRHGFVAANAIEVLRSLIRPSDAFVSGDVGMLTPSGSVLGPDVAVVTGDRMRAYGRPAGWLPGPVDIAIEIIGTDEKQAELDRKIEEYFAAGVRQVWKVNPETRKVAQHRSPKDVLILGGEDELSATDIHPALRFPVQALFESA